MFFDEKGMLLSQDAKFSVENNYDMRYKIGGQFQGRNNFRVRRFSDTECVEALYYQTAIYEYYYYH